MINIREIANEFMKIREIANELAGRSRILREALDIDGTKRFLESLDGGTRGEIQYGTGLIRGFTHVNATPRYMVEFVGEKFNTKGIDYIDVRHEIYSGGPGPWEKHYLDLTAGTLVEVKACVVRRRLVREASIKFVLKKEAPEGLVLRV